MFTTHMYELLFGGKIRRGTVTREKQQMTTTKTVAATEIDR